MRQRPVASYWALACGEMPAAQAQGRRTRSRRKPGSGLAGGSGLPRQAGGWVPCFHFPERKTGGLGVLQDLSGASASDFFSHHSVPPPVRPRTSSSPHRLPLKGGVIFRRDRVGKRGSCRFLFYEKMTVGVGLEGRLFACHSRPAEYTRADGDTLITPPLRGSRRSRAERRRLMRWGVWALRRVCRVY